MVAKKNTVSAKQSSSTPVQVKASGKATQQSAPAPAVQSGKGKQPKTTPAVATPAPAPEPVVNQQVATPASTSTKTASKKGGAKASVAQPAQAQASVPASTTSTQTAGKRTPAKRSVKKTAKKTTKAPRATVAKKTRASKTAPKDVQAGGNQTEEEDSRTRYFKVIVDGGEAHGRFSGSKPKQAANKALTSIVKSRESIGQQTEGQIKFSIIECTRGSRQKTYNYIGERHLLDTPMKVPIGKGTDAKVIEYKYNNKVMKDKQPVSD